MKTGAARLAELRQIRKQAKMLVTDFLEARTVLNKLRDKIEGAGWLQKSLVQGIPAVDSQGRPEYGVVDIEFKNGRYGMLRVHWEVDTNLLDPEDIIKI